MPTIEKIKEDYCLKFGNPTRSHDCIQNIEESEPVCLACKIEYNIKKKGEG